MVKENLTQVAADSNAKIESKIYFLCFSSQMFLVFFYNNTNTNTNNSYLPRFSAEAVIFICCLPGSGFLTIKNTAKHLSAIYTPH